MDIPQAAPRAEIRPLTGIRGLAACMVVFYHYFQDSTGLGPAHALIVHSYIAVDLFFVLSGFVMAMTYARTFTPGFAFRSYLGFLGKRLGRIYPLYLVVTLLAAALIYVGAIKGTPPGPAAVASNVLMVQAWGFADSIGGPTWSISTEFACYLAFPLLVAACLTSRRTATWAAAALSFAVLILLASLSAGALHQVFDGVISRSGPLDVFGTGTLYPLMRCFAGFVLGLTAFRASTHPTVQRIGSLSAAGDAIMAAVVILWALHGTDVLLVAAFVPLVIALALGNSWTARVLASGPITWLGEISYSIYLVHRPIENLLRHPLVALLNAHHVPHAYTAAGIIPLVLTLFVSAASFYGIEKPARDWTRRLMRPALRSAPAT